ncbi:SCO family protein [soil metagenome]
MKRLLLTLAITALTVTGIHAQMSYGRAPRPNPEPSLPDGVGLKQKPGEQVPLDLVFHDHDGKEVSLKDCVGGKPTILVLAYFSCPKLCTEVLNGLVGELKALTRLGLRAGKDFNVVTVSINPKDAPAFARMKRLSYLDEYDHRAETEAGWWFLTASHGQGTNLIEAEEKIRKLADAVGFNYVANNHEAYKQAAAEPDSSKQRVKLDTAIRKTKDYIHPSAVMILTPDGKLSQYFHGLPKSQGGTDLEAGYNAEDLRLALSNANGGKIGTMLNRMAVNCFAYDDLSATYKLNMEILRWVAAPFVLLVLGIVYRAWRHSKREKALTPTDAINAIEDVK